MHSLIFFFFFFNINKFSVFQKTTHTSEQLLFQLLGYLLSVKEQYIQLTYYPTQPLWLGWVTLSHSES